MRVASSRDGSLRRSVGRMDGGGRVNCVAIHSTVLFHLMRMAVK